MSLSFESRICNTVYSSRYSFIDYAVDIMPLRRTVNNDYAPTPPPPPPVFSIKPSSPYTWVKPTGNNVTRIIPSRKSDVERERERVRDYKIMTHPFMVSRKKKKKRKISKESITDRITIIFRHYKSLNYSKVILALCYQTKTVSPPYKEDWSFGTKSR